MLGWSKRPEDSDIRAKFELRREQIRQGVLGAGRVAGARFEVARAATVAGLKAAGSAVRAGAQAGREAASLGMRRTLSGLAATAARGRSGRSVLRDIGCRASSGQGKILNPIRIRGFQP